jgi:hypothetical protein
MRSRCVSARDWMGSANSRTISIDSRAIAAATMPPTRAFIHAIVASSFAALKKGAMMSRYSPCVGGSVSMGS